MSATSRGLREAATFARFGAVGAVGFLVDAAALQLLVTAGGWPPVVARLPSFAVAVLATFALNRRWTFAKAGTRGVFADLVGYLGVQGVAFGLNLGTFAAWVLTMPAPFDAPILGLAVGSALGLVINFAGSRFLVFGPRARAGRATEP